MSLFLLDTDTLSLLEQGHALVLHQVNSHPATEIAVSAISIQESALQRGSPLTQGWTFP